MQWIPILIALVSLAALIRLWFRTADQAMREKLDIVQSAQSQLNAYREALRQVEDAEMRSHAEEVTSRCRDIYVQAVALYNQTLSRPANRIPGMFLGYRLIEDEQ